MNRLKLIPGPTSIVWILLTAALLIGVKLYKPPMVERIQLTGFDLMLANDRVVKSEAVVIVDVESLENPKDLSQTITRIQSLGAAAIVVPERITNTSAELANVLSHSNTVIAQFPSSSSVVVSKPDIVRRTIEVIGDDPHKWLLKWDHAVPPYKNLTETAAGVGAVVFPVDTDGVLRRMPLIIELNNDLYPTLAFEALRVATAQNGFRIKSNSTGIELVRITGQPLIDTDEHGQTLLRWDDEFQKYTLRDIQNKGVNFKGKIVVLASTKDDNDSVFTPQGPKLPHYIHAQSIQTLLDNDSPTRPTYANVVEILAIILGAALLYCIVPKLPLWALGVSFLITTLGTLGLSFFLWRTHSQLWDMGYLIVCAIILYSHAYVVRLIIQLPKRRPKWLGK